MFFSSFYQFSFSPQTNFSYKWYTSYASCRSLFPWRGFAGLAYTRVSIFYLSLCNFIHERYIYCTTVRLSFFHFIQSRWVIPPDEHDAHELLHVMLASLEEEAIRPKKVGYKLNSNSIKRSSINENSIWTDWLSIRCVRRRFH